MNNKIKFGLATMLAVVLVAVLAVAWLSLGNREATTGTVRPLHMQPFNNILSSTSGASGYNCTFQTLAGYYLTAVNGGGRTSDVIHSDATRAQSWEKFNLIAAPLPGDLNLFAIQTTVTGNYLTAVSGGGRETDVIHSNATVVQSWERFRIIPGDAGLVAIQTTVTGNYLTAVGEGGRETDVIHSDATRLQAWEEFHLLCGQ